MAFELNGKLIDGSAPELKTSAVQALLDNPFYIHDQPGLTQSAGWIGAWQSEASRYAVRASSARDVAAAVRFASSHRLRLVVKGGGHSYLGGSNAPDSLLVWMHDMDKIELHDQFVPEGCARRPVPAVSVGAGCLWGRVYKAVSVDAGRYVQGGGCTTVGVAGLVQGGGFGSFSKGFGTAAANLLEAEIVTADGETRTINECRNPDLFWAIKGGGGGTFGIITRLTLRTHDLPETVGEVAITIEARDDPSFQKLLSGFLQFCAASLLTPHWGEQVRATPDRRLVVSMLFQGLDGEEAHATWKPFVDRVKGDPALKITEPFVALAVPARRFWDADFLSSHVPNAVKLDRRPVSRPGDYWWAGDGDQVGATWTAYSSLWLPRSLLDHAERSAFADAWFRASRTFPVAFHFNKGLAGASDWVIDAVRQTAMNPQVLDAFALAIIATSASDGFRPLSAKERSSATKDDWAIHAATRELRKVVPDAGSYVSECDYFLADWRRACWGEHWRRLARIKRKYDPAGLFFVHHGIGSEEWSTDGFERRG